VIWNTVPKKGEGKNLCNTRDVVAKLFIAVLPNKAFGYGGSQEHTRGGAVLAYLFTDSAFGAGGH
jgi:hypothetical protein